MCVKKKNTAQTKIKTYILHPIFLLKLSTIPKIKKHQRIVNKLGIIYQKETKEVGKNILVVKSSTKKGRASKIISLYLHI